MQFYGGEGANSYQADLKAGARAESISISGIQSYICSRPCILGECLWQDPVSSKAGDYAIRTGEP